MSSIQTVLGWIASLPQIGFIAILIWTGYGVFLAAEPGVPADSAGGFVLFGLVVLGLSLFKIVIRRPMLGLAPSLQRGGLYLVLQALALAGLVWGISIESGAKWPAAVLTFGALLALGISICDPIAADDVERSSRTRLWWILVSSAIVAVPFGLTLGAVVIASSGSTLVGVFFGLVATVSMYGSGMALPIFRRLLRPVGRVASSLADRVVEGEKRDRQTWEAGRQAREEAYLQRDRYAITAPAEFGPPAIAGTLVPFARLVVFPLLLLASSIALGLPVALMFLPRAFRKLSSQISEDSNGSPSAPDPEPSST